MAGMMQRAAEDPFLAAISRLLTIFITLIAIPAGSWLGTQVIYSSTRIEVLNEQVTQLRHEIRTAALDAYKSVDAARDFALRDLRIGRNEERLDRVEELLDRALGELKNQEAR